MVGSKESKGVAASAPAPAPAPAATDDAADDKSAPKKRGHFRRFKWWYIGGLIVSLAITLPVFFVVILPKIAQLLVDNTPLSVVAASMTEATPNNITLSLVAGMTIPKPFTVGLKPFNLSMYNPDPMNASAEIIPFLHVRFPKSTLKGKAQLAVTNQTTEIINMGEFEKFLQAATYQQNFTMAATGSTHALIGKLKLPISFNKKLTLAGVNKFAGFSIGELKLLIPAEEDGTNIIGNVIIPNASKFRLALGNVSLNLKSQDLNIGIARLYNTDIASGNNTLPFNGTLDYSTIISNIFDLLLDQAGPLTDGEIELIGTGNSTTYNGVHITYLENLLNALTLKTKLPIGQLLQGVL